jgi:hypothetical protein
MNRENLDWSLNYGVGSRRSTRLPIFDLPVSVYASQSHLELEAREDGRERHGQTDD